MRSGSGLPLEARLLPNYKSGTPWISPFLLKGGQGPGAGNPRALQAELDKNGHCGLQPWSHTLHLSEPQFSHL